MWYDSLPEEKQDEIAEIVLKFKNPDKDPEKTKQFTELTLKHAAVFTASGEYRRLASHTKRTEHIEISKWLSKTHAKDTLEVGFAYGTSALIFAEHHQ
jgi:hypothetical protein